MNRTVVVVADDGGLHYYDGLVLGEAIEIYCTEMPDDTGLPVGAYYFDSKFVGAL